MQMEIQSAVPRLSSPRMPPQSDLTAISPDGRPVLAIECKGGNTVSAESAAVFRRNLLLHKQIPTVPFFMMAYPRTLFLWRLETPAEGDPDFQAPTESILLDYAPQLSAPAFSVQQSSLEIVIQSWLADLIAGIRQPKQASKAEQMLVSAGVYDQIRNGSVVHRLRT
jgi:hypothetical protein